MSVEVKTSENKQMYDFFSDLPKYVVILQALPYLIEINIKW